MKTPLVSIIIPVYNGSNYLRDAIDSAIVQTCKNIEIIVVNDGSTDRGATDKIARSYGNKIRYLPKKNGGVATALNFGIKHMKGVWFSWLSHDDTYLPDKLSKQIGYITEHPGTKIVYTDYELVDSQLQHLHDIYVGPKNITDMRLRLMNSYPLNGCTMLIHKTCFKNVGVFNAKLATTQDYDLWFRLAGKYPFHYLPKVTVRSRQHSEQGSHSNQHKEEVDQFYAKSLNELLRSKQVFRQLDNAGSWLLKLALSYQSEGFPNSAHIGLTAAATYLNPANPLLLLTRLYCSLPTSLTVKMADIHHHLSRTIFGVSGYLKRHLK